MIVRHTKRREEQINDLSLSINKYYIVLGVYFTPSRGIEFIVQCDDDGEPAWFSSKYFELVDSKLPPDYAYTFYENGRTELEPVAFDDDFWERFHDGDPEAEKIFKETVNRIKAFHHLA